MELKERRAVYLRRLEESLDRLVQVLSAMPEVERIIIFGSYARGRRDLLTDLDILVVMCTDLPPLERSKLLYQTLALPVDLDLLCYTPEELEAAKESPFLKAILKEGIVLYEKKPG
jgi:predicted nucleotidyltransferase